MFGLEGGSMPRVKTVRTTLGDLIEALTEETFEYVHNEEEANILVAYLLADVLHSSAEAPVTWH
jgi:hypothetical protein